jgi:hypothetical protein
MPRFSFPLALLCLASLEAACDLPQPTAPSTQSVTVRGFAGRGLWSDSIASGGAPFQLIAQDSSGQGKGEFIMLGDTIPPAGTYDADNNQFPPGLSQLEVDFVRFAGDGTSELFQPAGGKMVITSITADSITGSLNLVMPLVATCTGNPGAVTCMGINSNTVLALSGSFVARRASANAVPAP